VPELTAAERAAGPRILDPALGLQSAIDVRLERDRPRPWLCCLCSASGAGGRRQAHVHYLLHHFEPLEAAA
jgi:hypothetical protein